MAQYGDDPLSPGIRGMDESVTVGMLVWRTHRTLTTVRLLIQEAVGEEGGTDDLVRCLLETTTRARGMASELIDAVNAGHEWGELSYRLVDAVTAVVGLASYVRVRRRRQLPNIGRIWRVIEDTLDATRELAKRARAISLEARILLTVESSLHTSPRLLRASPPRRSRRVSAGEY